jgi:hypothetical protein
MAIGSAFHDDTYKLIGTYDACNSPSVCSLKTTGEDNASEVSFFQSVDSSTGECRPKPKRFHFSPKEKKQD